VKRALTLLATVLLLVPAAAGLSSATDGDYCRAHQPFHASAAKDRMRRAGLQSFRIAAAPLVSREVALWPPGPRCVYEYSDGRVVKRPLGDVGAFFAVIAAGAVAAARRNRYARATLLSLAVAGVGFLLYGIEAIVPAVSVGIVVAYAGTRSCIATTTAVGVLVFGGLVELAGGGVAGWTVLLALAPRAESLFGSGQERRAMPLARPSAEF
jgi:hypothetical protein